MKYVIVDVDGTVALRQVPGRRPYDWDRVGEDLPNLPVIEVILGLEAAGFQIVFVSGRKVQAQAATLDWIKRHMGSLRNYRLFMRVDNDNRSDTELKREIYETKLFPWFGRPVAVFDDRNSVVAMWRSLGLCVLHVCDVETGDF